MKLARPNQLELFKLLMQIKICLFKRHIGDKKLQRDAFAN